MFVHPSAAFPTYHRSSASPYHRQAYSSFPSSSCGGQHHHAEPHAYYSRYGAPGGAFDTHMDSDDDDDTGNDEAAAYYQYLLAAARKEQRQKELRRQAREQAEAEARAERAREQERRERRAAQQLAFLKARARAVAQAEAEAHAAAAAAAERQKEQRRLHAQARAEQERKVALAEQYMQYIQHRQQDQERYTAEMQRRQAVQAERERQRQATIEKQRNVHHADSQEDLLRSIFGEWLSLPAPTARSASSSPSPAPIPTSKAHSQPAAKATDTRTPATSPSEAKVAHFDTSSAISNATAPRDDETNKVKTVHSVRSKFESLKTGFKPNDALVFDPARSTPQAPFLAYNTPANRPLQEYEEHLTRLLTELDAIASDGIEAIRAERKRLNNDVQSELSRLDELRAQAWKAQHPDAEQQQAPEQEKEHEQEVQEAAAVEPVDAQPIHPAEDKELEGASASESGTTGEAFVEPSDMHVDAANPTGSNDNIDSTRQADVATDSHPSSPTPTPVPADLLAEPAPSVTNISAADLSGVPADAGHASLSEATPSEPAAPSPDNEQAVSEASPEQSPVTNSNVTPSTSPRIAIPADAAATSADAPTSKRQPDSSSTPDSFMLPPALGLDLIASIVHEAAGDEDLGAAGSSDVSGDSDSETSFEML